MALQISDFFIYLTTIFQQHRLEMPWIELELATLGSYDVKPKRPHATRPLRSFMSKFELFFFNILICSCILSVFIKMQLNTLIGYVHIIVLVPYVFPCIYLTEDGSL